MSPRVTCGPLPGKVLLIFISIGWVLVYASSAGAQGGLAAPGEGVFQVNTYTSGTQFEPAVAGEANGGFVVAWTAYQIDGDDTGIAAQRFASDGSRLGVELEVNTYTSGRQRYPAIAASANGDVLVAWVSSLQDGSSNGVFARRFGGDGRPIGSAFQVNTYTESDQGGNGNLAVAADASGRFVVVWSSHGQDGDNNGVFAQRFGSDGRALGTEFQVNRFTLVHQETPAVVSDAAGNFTVVWKALSEDDTYNDVFGQRFGSGGERRGTEFRVNALGAGDQGYYLAAGAAPNGDFVVAWSSEYVDDPGNGIVAQRFDENGSRLGDELLVNSTVQPGGGAGVGVAVDASGDFAVVWQGDAESGQAEIFGQRFRSDGTRLGTEFRVDSTAGRREAPAAASDASGRFIVVWQMGSNVFGRRFGTASAACGGDCDGDLGVTIDELVLGVDVALGVRPLEACARFDESADGVVTIDELVAAVRNALRGCGAA